MDGNTHLNFPLLTLPTISNLWYLHFQIPILIRYAYGPFPLFLCYLDYICKNTLMFKIIITSDFVLIVQYIFVFHSKNPTAVQDDFWTFFLNLWAYSKFHVMLQFLQIWTHAHMDTCKNIFMHKRTQTYKQPCTHVPHAQMHPCTYALRHTCTHAHIHTYTHTHIHIWLHVY